MVAQRTDELTDQIVGMVKLPTSKGTEPFEMSISHWIHVRFWSRSVHVRHWSHN
jgi:hypothetical protein